MYVLAYAGLRFGEAAALRRGRCELLRSRLHVVESLAEVGGRLIFGETKTHAQRFVSLPEFLRDALASHLRAVPPGPESLVFSGRTGGPLRYSAAMRHAWRPAVRAAGLDQLGYPVTPHLLRHSCATLLIASGASPRDVADHLGHADVGVTLNVYAAAFEGHAEALAGRLDAIRAAAVRP